MLELFLLLQRAVSFGEQGACAQVHGLHIASPAVGSTHGMQGWFVFVPAQTLFLCVGQVLTHADTLSTKYNDFVHTPSLLKLSFLFGFWKYSYCVNKVDLDLTVMLLPMTLKCWDHSIHHHAWLNKCFENDSKDLWKGFKEYRRSPTEPLVTTSLGQKK